MATPIISLSIKKCHLDVYLRLQKLMPKNTTWSNYVFSILEQYSKDVNSGIVNFYQSPNFWNEYVKSLSPEEYKKFYTQLDLLRQIERVNTGKRLITN